MKMADARLRSRLVKAGYRPENVAQMERTQLLNEWSQVVVATQEQIEEADGEEQTPSVAEAAGTEGFGDSGWVGVDPEVLKARIALEEIKLDMQARLREKELDLKAKEADLRPKEAEIKDQQ